MGLQEMRCSINIYARGLPFTGLQSTWKLNSVYSGIETAIRETVVARNLSNVPCPLSDCDAFPERLPALLQPYRHACICMGWAPQTFGGLSLSGDIETMLYLSSCSQ